MTLTVVDVCWHAKLEIPYRSSYSCHLRAPDRYRSRAHSRPCLVQHDTWHTNGERASERVTIEELYIFIAASLLLYSPLNFCARLPSTADSFEIESLVFRSSRVFAWTASLFSTVCVQQVPPGGTSQYRSGLSGRKEKLRLKVEYLTYVCLSTEILLPTVQTKTYLFPLRAFHWSPKSIPAGQCPASSKIHQQRVQAERQPEKGKVEIHNT